ncbi:MAG: hypothetical protein HY719_13810 [Planctomycetes bacterium]|nr:hypothetical protein [Planctomycetota bacterium]
MHVHGRVMRCVFVAAALLAGAAGASFADETELQARVDALEKKLARQEARMERQEARSDQFSANPFDSLEVKFGGYVSSEYTWARLGGENQFTVSTAELRITTDFADAANGRLELRWDGNATTSGSFVDQGYAQLSLKRWFNQWDLGDYIPGDDLYLGMGKRDSGHGWEVNDPIDRWTITNTYVQRLAVPSRYVGAWAGWKNEWVGLEGFVANGLEINTENNREKSFGGSFTLTPWREGTDDIIIITNTAWIGNEQADSTTNHSGVTAATGTRVAAPSGDKFSMWSPSATIDLKGTGTEFVKGFAFGGDYCSGNQSGPFALRGTNKGDFQFDGATIDAKYRIGEIWPAAHDLEVVYRYSYFDDEDGAVTGVFPPPFGTFTSTPPAGGGRAGLGSGQFLRSHTVATSYAFTRHFKLSAEWKRDRTDVRGGLVNAGIIQKGGAETNQRTNDTVSIRVLFSF